MIKAGDLQFNELNVAFHFIRKNVWSPWETIGVYVTCNTYARCRYTPRYSHIEDSFDDEVEDAGRLVIAGSVEFLDLWRRDYQEPESVISPIVNYCTMTDKFAKLMNYLYTRYVGNDSGKIFAALAIMLKSRERHFPIAFSEGQKNHATILHQLRKDGLINYD